MSLAGLETQDLGQFNFDINDLNPFPQNSSFDFSVDSQLSNFQFDNNLGHTPLMADQYGLDQWASAFGGEEMPVHTRPHESSPARDSGRLDSSFQTSWLYDVPDVSPTTTESLAQGYFPDGSLRQPQPFQNATTDASPLTSASDWSILEASMNASPASQDASTPASSESQSNSQIRTRKRRAVDDDSAEATLPLANQRGSGSGIEVDPSDIPHPGGDGNSLVSSSSRQGRLFTQRNAVPQASLRTLPSSPVISIAAFAESCQAACDALMSISSAPVEATSLRRDLERLQSILHQVQSDSDAHLPSTVLQELPSLSSRLQVISAPSSEVLSDSAQRHRYNKPDPEIRADYLRECQIQARRIVRSLCATINSVQAHNTGTASSTDDLMLTSGRNVHLFASASRSPSPESGVQMWVESTSQWQMMSDSPSPMDDSTASASRANVQAAVASTVSNDEGRAGYRSLSGGAVLIANDLASDGPLASTVSEQQPLSQSQRGGDQVSTSLPFFDEDLDFDVQVHRHRSHAQANSAPALDTINSAASTLSRVDDLAQASSSPQNRDLQVRRTENAPPSSTLLSPGTAAPTSLVQSTANPQATGLAMQTSPDAPLGLPATTTTGHQTQSLAAHQLLLPLLATLFASYIASSNNALSPSLQYLLIPLALSSLLSTSIFACSSIFLAALSFNNLDLPRHAASQWVGSDPVVAMVKLTLCAVLTAQLPRFLVSRARMGVAVMGLLSMFDGQGCRGTGTGSLSTYSEEGEGRLTPTPEWLVEMRELTPVVVV
ncbi:uncharacterized protein LY89DRAFT_283032 [Mollisia scopiformis]|uniref:Uncharacterized protein n=1 Tax=Mollisia scopiformis TaxID=149040 RepID=A0A132BA56_MOLSC|nr:uncharacterized protein LY89DRAFT_283032 [Mollisia scopiformis]KUJ09290.1 hypothetical protein LY89DRAFT_283032 [Mollisia scopiformis]